MAEQRVAPRAESRPRHWWRTSRAVFGAVVLTLLVVFFAQNFDDVEVSFLAWQFDFKLALLILAAVVLGVVLGFLLPRVRRSAR
ncbi:MAG: lipopolysaccharide assembly protein LapA domain-containing protein [Thermomicrobiales bacterium]